MSNPPSYTQAQPGDKLLASTQPPPYGQPNAPQLPMYPSLIQQTPPQHSTIIIQTTQASPVPVGSRSTHIQCPACHAEVLTKVKYTTACRAHCWACILCCCICWPCVCIPYCMDSCQNANHYCPNCNAYIGTYQN